MSPRRGGQHGLTEDKSTLIRSDFTSVRNSAVAGEHVKAQCKWVSAWSTWRLPRCPTHKLTMRANEQRETVSMKCLRVKPVQSQHTLGHARTRKDTLGHAAEGSSVKIHYYMEERTQAAWCHAIRWGFLEREGYWLIWVNLDSRF